MDKLQATLADVEKDLKALTSKKKKVIALINKYQEKLFKSQEMSPLRRARFIPLWQIMICITMKLRD
ncbi:hypothetical protein H5410_012435 [Solanum commersonii]|uniref:Uncharacterized protein n=1 Tax=Solanum commersonii TaxID=4109 RepID=A0A9J6ASD0_SOLCO|nr:hypothetical protein H5410_012435 [Solanum commersonii]